MLSIKSLSSGYRGQEVIHDIAFSIQKGEQLYIAGPNGSGKTTLLKCIAGLQPYTGQILLDGQEIHSIKRRELARQIGILTQISSVYFPYTVYETAAFGRYSRINGIFGGMTGEDRSYIDHCLETVGLFELRNRKINELSGGQLQRVYLARLFVQDPDIILMDEPTNHLDLKYQIELLQYVTDWSEQKHKTIIGVLHDLNLVNTFAKRALLLFGGKVFSDGYPQDSLSGENLRECYGIDIRQWMCRALEGWKE